MVFNQAGSGSRGRVIFRCSMEPVNLRLMPLRDTNYVHADLMNRKATEFMQ